MKQKRLSIYQIDMKYVRDLAKADDKVMSVSPQENKESRPFVGIVVIMNDKKYCIPLSSPKSKHNQMKNDVDFTKIYDKDKLLGVLNFNNMIPVDESVLKPLDLRIKSNDSPQTAHYKKMTAKQLNWCQQNQDAIVVKANKLYGIITQTPEKSRNLTRRCCDFKKLEAVLEKRLAKSAEQSKPTVHTEAKKPSILGQIKEIKAEQDKRNQEHIQERGAKKQNISHKKDCL